ncbi:MAG: hypothetical protein GX451_08615 [Acholeplasmataceae bacterium]|nr:hypothetical protein [Acholeplasmataceae bacterium]
MACWNPTEEQSRFIKRYAKAMDSGDVGIFVGAGLSRAAGFVDWRSLLKDIATELQLDIDRETDLIAIAQYHLNEKHHRGRLNQAIVEELSSSLTPTQSHRILARLPISTAWTTNYDQLLEHSFEDAGKIVDLKLTQENLAQTKPGRDVVLYKMHGCVSQPQDAVVTKDDYEQYESKRRLFVESLKGDLISKTFLFLGYSFNDPNIDYILSRVRVLIGANIRDHFCVMRIPERPIKMVGYAKAEFEYEQRKMIFRQADLQRFGIETVWINDFSQVECLLRTLSTYIHRKTVFVSGAAYDPAPLGRERLDNLTREIGTHLIGEGYNLVSGFGVGLGEQCVIGALQALYGIPKGADLERLIVRPFPQTEKADQSILNTHHREDLIARSGVIVVIAGNHKQAGGNEISPGVLEEVNIALREGKCVIPIGATGHAARKIWEQAIVNPEQYLPRLKVKKEMTTLGDSSATNEQIIKALFSILKKITDATML